MKWTLLSVTILMLPAGSCVREGPPSVEGFCDSTLEDRNQLSAAGDQLSDQAAPPAARLITKTDAFCASV